MEYEECSMDRDFIERATKINSFNINTKDLKSNLYKKEMRYLYQKYAFPTFDLNNLRSGIEINHINNMIDILKSIDRTAFNKLFNYRPIGIGSGEVLLYFLIDDAIIVGSSSSGIDIIIGDKNYEVKSVFLSGDKKCMFNFKLGVTLDVMGTVQKINDMKKSLKLQSDGKGKVEVKSSSIEIIKNRYPIEWKKIETKYKKLACDYFNNVPVIFFNNKKTRKGLSVDAGSVISIQKITRNNIEIERVTQGVIKPKILVNTS